MRRASVPISSPSCVRREPWLGACLLLGALTIDAARGEERPFGLDHRLPWTTSKLIGSPEPPLEFTVERVYQNLALTSPIYVIEEPTSDHLLIVLTSVDGQQASRIVRVSSYFATDKFETYFELPGRLLYSLVFHPDFASNGFVYLFSNGPTGAAERTNRVARYSVPSGEHRLAPDSEQIIVEWRSMGHDGGDLVFGTDGMLYITTGDGTSDSDTWDSGQTIDDLLGSVLRIDVDHPGAAAPYTVPADNPFVNAPGARGEIWAYGLRNPWRMCVDRQTGHLWVGNNGQDLWETAHLVRRGDNFGWSVYEGNHPFYFGRRRGPTPLVPPTIEHHHAEFRSLTGGDVYYGEQFPELAGAYLYGDYSSGRIWGMKHDGQRIVWHRELADTQLAIAAFRTTRSGEMLIVDHTGGALYRLVRNETVAPPAPFPQRLSETGLFASTAEHRAAAGAIPYSINAPGWHDGATAERFLAVPGDAQVGYTSGPSWNFPDGTALVQTLSIALPTSGHGAAATDATARRIETRVLLRQQGEWAGYSYRWNEAQSDALLVPRAGADATLPSSDPSQPRAWRFPSRAECLACHSRAANFVLGLTEAQLNRDHAYPASTDNQLRALEHIGLFSGPLPKPPAELARLTDPRDSSHTLEERARAYLHVNCSVCHVAAGGGNARMELGLATPTADMKLIGARPQHDTFGIDNAMLVAPGQPDRSVLVRRLSQRGAGQMPPLVSRQVDVAAVELLRAWISQLQPARAFIRDWQLEDLAPALDRVATGRSFKSGQTLFREIGCTECHRFGSEGGSVGPNLAGIGRRLTPRDLLESLLSPAKTIADEYAVFVVATEQGGVYSGRVERQDAQTLVLRATAADEAPIEIATSEIAERHKSNISNMPAGTLNVLKEDEILDLLGYLLSDANADDPRFR
ncbi:MAG: PQQ-dependent sugar dehydrogenase [Pirellulales bacterium]|nr:PQQ-dependent sugar dehydrogenase [Pirellulales bacterium]